MYKKISTCLIAACILSAFLYFLPACMADPKNVNVSVKLQYNVDTGGSSRDTSFYFYARLIKDSIMVELPVTISGEPETYKEGKEPGKGESASK